MSESTVFVFFFFSSHLFYTNYIKLFSKMCARRGRRKKDDKTPRLPKRRWVLLVNSTIWMYVYRTWILLQSEVRHGYIQTQNKQFWTFELQCRQLLSTQSRDLCSAHTGRNPPCSTCAVRWKDVGQFLLILATCRCVSVGFSLIVGKQTTYQKNENVHLQYCF